MLNDGTLTLSKRVAYLSDAFDATRWLNVDSPEVGTGTA